MTICVLCEKPSQARDIAKVVGAHSRDEGFMTGNGYCVTWCLGHLLELAPPEHYQKNLKPWRIDVLPIIPESWHLSPNKKTYKQLKVIENILKKTEHVIVATDADREGDVIGREVLDYFHYDGKIQRLWLSALDDVSIKQAFLQLKPNEFSANLYQAGLGRQRADWLMGMNMTMATTVKFSCGNGVLSVGRVQSPALKLVVDRDNQIEKFKPQDYFDLIITAEKEAGDFKAKWLPQENFSDEAGRCLREEYVQAVKEKVHGASVEVVEFDSREKTQRPPLGLALSTLQKLASSKWGFSAKETLQVAQSLYETHKATSYPRTDCQYLPMSQFADAKTIMEALRENACYRELVDKADINIKSPIWNDKKVTAHHAIIPTMNKKVSLLVMGDKEKKIYDLICRYFLAQFLGNYHYEYTEVTLGFELEIFKTSTHSPKIQGWKVAISSEEPVASKENASHHPDQVQNIPSLNVGEKLHCSKSEIEKKKTKPLPRFTEGTLITAMKSIAKYLNDESLKKTLKEAAGIGTEATRANIIETLINRDYITRTRKSLISTSKGRELIALIPGELSDPVLTAQWESELELVATGHLTLASFMASQQKFLSQVMVKLQESSAEKISGETEIFHCARCQSALSKRTGKYGKFWGCTNYPECTAVYKDINNAPFLEKEKYACPSCENGFLQLRKGKSGKFWGCNRYPGCKVIVNDKRGKPESNS